MSTIVIAGATGFIGRHLRQTFAGEGIDVRTIGRSSGDARWGQDLRPVLEGSAALINLAGRSVSCRYTKRNADAIFSSRTETTKALGHALATCQAPPPVWLNSSTGTIYRDARDRPQDEKSGELGTGFSVAVARAWEQELYDAPVAVRKVALRTSIVLGAGGGALNPLINLARMGFGGAQGDGGQMFSWVHVEDLVAAIRHSIEHAEISGPVNVATPNPVTNAALMKAVRRHFGWSAGVPLPAWSLTIGGHIIRTEEELVLKSRWVHPGVLMNSGFTFRHPRIDDALAAIAAQTPRGLLPVQLG